MKVKLTQQINNEIEIKELNNKIRFLHKKFYTSKQKFKLSMAEPSAAINIRSNSRSSSKLVGRTRDSSRRKIEFSLGKKGFESPEVSRLRRRTDKLKLKVQGTEYSSKKILRDLDSKKTTYIPFRKRGSRTQRDNRLKGTTRQSSQKNLEVLR